MRWIAASEAFGNITTTGSPGMERSMPKLMIEMPMRTGIR